MESTWTPAQRFNENKSPEPTVDEPVEPDNTSVPPVVQVAAEPDQFKKPPAIVAPPSSFIKPGEKNDVRLVTVTLNSTGFKDRDIRRIRHVHGLLNSFPGRDRFCFLVFEHGFRHLLDFPNDTTNANPELINQLVEFVGKDNVLVENL